jgi:glycosyltransferase involved in cell wall biosynthesis
MGQMDVFCSTIIPTVNRPTLTRAVRSVLDQGFRAAAHEVIVVNDSGYPLPAMEWQHCEGVKVIDTNRRERSVARNTGAAIARGKYLHFLDDDDIILPGALEAFWRLDQTSQAIWLYGSYRTVDNDGNLIEEIRPGIGGNIFASLVGGESIPFQLSLLRSDYFFKAGGFDPNITGVEDRDVGRRMALLGEVAFLPQVVAQIRIGELGSTTNWAILAEDDRWGREKALNDKRAFHRLRASAHSGYLCGRVCRAYLASLVWNVKKKNICIALNRGILGLAFTGLNIIRTDFWRGVRTRVK